MQKILLKRTLRDLKANAFRYMTLFFLIVLALFLVIGTIGAAQSVIGTAEASIADHHLEDGQFQVFQPLTGDELREIRKLGVSLKESFYQDFAMEDDSTLRVMKNRVHINTVQLAGGKPAETDTEIVVERVYAAAHGISVGDVITIAGKRLTVVGIGSSVDYENCLQNMTDSSSDGKNFGIAFAAPGLYEELLQTNQALHAEEYSYSYRLKEGTANQDLKDYLLDLEVQADDIRDPFFQDAVKEQTKDRQDMSNGVADVADGAVKIDDALKSVNEGTNTMQEGIAAAYQGFAKLDQTSPDLTNGSSAVLTALNTLEDSLSDVNVSTDSIADLTKASAKLLTGTKQMNDNLKELAGSVSYDKYKAVLSNNGLDPSTLSPDALAVLGVTEQYLDEVNGYLAKAASGSEALYKNFKSFDEAVASLPKGMNELNSGLAQLSEAVATLCSEYQQLDTGIISYTDGVRKLYEGTAKLDAGAETLNKGTAELSEKSGDFRAGAEQLKTETDKLLDEYFSLEIPKLTNFVTAEDNPRIRAAIDDVTMNIKVGIWAGVIIIILITYVISVFVVHSIDQESAMIGTLYALGIKRRELMVNYCLLPVLICFIGGIAGVILGYSRFAIDLLAGNSFGYFSIAPIRTVLSPWLLAYGIVVPPLLALLINWLIIRKRLKRSALSLLRNETASKVKNHWNLTRLGFVRTFQLRQFIREKRSCFAILAGMFISLLLLTLALNCLSLCLNMKAENAADTKYEYMYQYKYPSKEVPKGGYAAYAEGLKKENLGYNMEISIIGLTKANPFFPAITSKRRNEISISSSVASKYGLSAGDKLVLNDEAHDKVYGFTVKEIVAYAPGLCCFMDIESMRTLFEQEEDYYNVVYADHPLNIETGRLYAVSTQSDVIKSADVFIGMMKPMMVMLISVSIILFVIVMYQMVKVMIDRSALNISLMKVFGYRSREVRRFYLDGNFLLATAGALILMPLSKAVMDALYPGFIANVACGIHLTWPGYLYLTVYMGIIGSYLLVQMALIQKLKRVTPAQVLKNRE